MNKLVEALAAKGIPTDKLSEEQLHSVAKALGLSTLLPRKVEVVDYTNKRGETNKFVKTENFVIGTKGNGSPSFARGLFLRVEALDQAIADLQEVRGLLSDQEDE